MKTLKDIVFRMVANKQLSAAQAMQLVGELGGEWGKPATSGRREIAVIGISGRFPGATSTQTFWENLRQGKSGISEVPASRWDNAAWYDPDPRKPNKTNCK